MSNSVNGTDDLQTRTWYVYRINGIWRCDTANPGTVSEMVTGNSREILSSPVGSFGRQDSGIREKIRNLTGLGSLRNPTAQERKERAR